jgi:hypothetical protein
MNIQLAKGVRPQGGQYVFIFASKMLLGILTASISKWNIRLDLPKSTCRRQNTGNSGGFHRGSQLQALRFRHHQSAKKKRGRFAEAARSAYGKRQGRRLSLLSVLDGRVDHCRTILRHMVSHAAIACAPSPFRALKTGAIVRAEVPKARRPQSNGTSRRSCQRLFQSGRCRRNQRQVLQTPPSRGRLSLCLALPPGRSRGY